MNSEKDDKRLVFWWLVAVYLGVVLMIVVGWITRLTGSGLSMVEWKPVSGFFPPLTHEGWVRIFEDYRASPQGRIVNAWMKLEDFQKIFFWEYVHRVLGRIEFFVAFVPWLYFKLGKKAEDSLRGLWPIMIWVLVILQGVLGWLMVASGLIHEPAVSHFRLAAHLSLAFFLGVFVLRYLLGLFPAHSIAPRGIANINLARGFLGLLAVQIVYGAFMGGKRAGLLYRTFPDMAGEYLPSETFFTGNLTFDLLSSPVGIHYVHRTLAWFVLGIGLYLVTRLWTSAPALRGWLIALSSLLVVQVTLGALTVMTGVSIPIAVAHQLVAFLVLSSGVGILVGLSRSLPQPTSRAS